MSGYLLDVNVLVALLDPLHVHHDRAHEWFGSEGRANWLSSPTTQNGVLRVVSHPQYPNHQPLPVVVASLQSALAVGGHRFVPDSLSLVTDVSDGGGVVVLERLATSAQVTDTYLLALAVANEARLATFDGRLATGAVVGGRAALQQIP